VLSISAFAAAKPNYPAFNRDQGYWIDACSASSFFLLSHFSTQTHDPEFNPPQDPLIARRPNITPTAIRMTTANMIANVTKK